MAAAAKSMRKPPVNPKREENLTPRKPGEPALPGFSGNRYSVEEVREHTEFIERMILQHLNEGQIAKACRERFGFGLFRVKLLQKRIHERWAEEDKDKRKYNKAIALREIQEAMRLARHGTKKKVKKRVIGPEGKPIVAEVEAWDIRPNLSAFRGLAELKSRIQGTMAPLEVSIEVQVHDALTGILSNMSSDEVQAAINEYDENVRLAEAAKSAGLLLPAPVDSAAE